jgi:hypothetical protein
VGDILSKEPIKIHIFDIGVSQAGRVSDLHLAIAHQQPKLIVVDTQPEDDAMPLNRSGKAHLTLTLPPLPEGEGREHRTVQDRLSGGELPYRPLRGLIR